MSQYQQPLQVARRVVEMHRRHLWLWVAPTIAMTLGAMVFALVRGEQWEASQALLVRDEAAGNFARPGRFEGTDTMKTFQETVLEVARNREVVRGALQQAGPPPGYRPAEQWPAAGDLDNTLDDIRVTAPKGAEFGKTEVIYVSAIGPTRGWAIGLTVAVCDRLEQQLGELRDRRATSVITELEESVRLAQADLGLATARLEAMERDVGSDLGELRALHESSGASAMRGALNQVTAELRDARAAFDSSQQLLNLLRLARQDTLELLATPSRLLDSQPSLRRLKDGLVDAQLTTSSLRGRMREDHPLVVAAVRAEVEVSDNLHTEIEAALRGAAGEHAVLQRSVENLETQQADLQNRLHRLASLRARYGNLVEEVLQRTRTCQQVQQELADARALRNAARSTSLITRFGTPIAGDKPKGPGGLVIVAAGLVGGLATGIGLVVLIVPVNSEQRRRWSDYVHAGRRATDRLFGRRASDQSEDPAGGRLMVRGTDVNYGRRATDAVGREVGQGR